MHDQRGGQPALRLIMGGVVHPNGTRALHPASLDFAEAAFTVMLGPSCVGKSAAMASTWPTSSWPRAHRGG